MEEKYLVIGGDGLVGRRFSKALSLKGKSFIETTRNREFYNRNRLHLDLAEDVANWPIPPDITVAFFMAGITSVEFCRSRPEESRTVNVERSIRLIERLFERGVFVVFPSTNLVFDGTRPFRKPTEPVSPRCRYGAMKADVEAFVLRESDLGCVVRLTKVAESLLPLARDWKDHFECGLAVEPFRDMRFSPISLDVCVEGMLSLAEKRLPGVFHFSGEEDVSYEEFCSTFADMLGVEEGARSGLVRPLSVREKLPHIETVPEHTTLDTRETFEALGIPPQKTGETLEALLRVLLAEQDRERSETS